MATYRIQNLRQNCRLKALCKFISVAACLIILSTLMVVNFYVSYNSCSINKASQEIRDLCTFYHRNEVAGNMCKKLCNENAFSIRSCGSDRGAWKNVCLADCEGCEPGKRVSQMVMKVQSEVSKWDLAINENIVINKSDSIEKSIASIRFHINNRVKVDFGRDYSKKKNILSIIWGQEFEQNEITVDNKDSIYVAAKSIASLALQQEYMAMRLIGEQPYMPKLYGTCGPAYFVENTPSFVKLGLVLFHGKLPELFSFKFASWQERAVIALKLINLLKTVDISFDIPMDMCNIKPDNCGVNEQMELTLLDTDSIRFGWPVDNGSQSCVTDNDCSWIKCHSYCNQTTKRCGGVRINNNLQVVCRHILLSRVENFGLLRNPPWSITTELYKTLQHCAYGEEVIDGVHWKKPQSDVMNKIESLVYSTLQS